MNFEGPLEDRLQIRERYGAYSDAAFRKDVDAWLSNWADDCVWFTWGQEFHGKAAMRAQWETVWTTMDHMAFFAEVAAIQVHGDAASARAYCHEILFLKDGGVRKIIGAYEDRLVRRDGAWLFARRDYKLLGDAGGG
jgi:ketosteroid isomerase-like protein